MEEKIVHEIAGIKYVLFEFPVPLGIESKIPKVITELGKKYKCIAQSMKVQSFGFLFPSRIMNCKILIPENSVFDFQNDFDILMK